MSELRAVDEGAVPASAPVTSRLFVLPVAARQWVSTDNNYLKAILLWLGFHHLWVDMIMRVVIIVSFSVLFNGDHLDSFAPSRGIHQGDPISPYLFLLAAEGLSCLLKS